MPHWIGRAGRALALGVAWGLAWAPVAVVIGVGLIDRDNSMDEMWPAVGAYPGFVSGALFHVLHGFTAHGRRLGDLSPSRAALLGAAAGLPVGLLPFIIGEPGADVPLWQLAGGFAGVVVLLSVLSAVVSAGVARILARRRARVEIRQAGSSQG